MPKLALPGRAVPRAALSEPQLVEQLVEVPTVLTYSLLQQRTAEQVVDTPVPHGRGRGARGGLQGLFPGTGFNSRLWSRRSCFSFSSRSWRFS